MERCADRFQQYRNQIRLRIPGFMATIRSTRSFAGVEGRSHEKCSYAIDDRNRVADIASGAGPRPAECGHRCQFHHRQSDSKRPGILYGILPRTVPGDGPRDLRIRLPRDILRQRIRLSAGTRGLFRTRIPWLLPLVVLPHPATSVRRTTVTLQEASAATLAETLPKSLRNSEF